MQSIPGPDVYKVWCEASVPINLGRDHISFARLGAGSLWPLYPWSSVGYHLSFSPPLASALPPAPDLSWWSANIILAFLSPQIKYLRKSNSKWGAIIAICSSLWSVLILSQADTADCSSTEHCRPNCSMLSNIRLLRLGPSVSWWMCYGWWEWGRESRRDVLHCHMSHVSRVEWSLEITIKDSLEIFQYWDPCLKYGWPRKEDDETKFKYVLLVFVSHFPGRTGATICLLQTNSSKNLIP